MPKKAAPIDLNAAQPELRPFCGSLTRYGHHGMLLTPGAFCVAELFDAMWLLDMIVSLQFEPSIARTAFQVWRLECSAHQDGWAVLSCATGSGKMLWNEAIGTDFRKPGVELWMSDLTIYLPSER